MIKQDNNLVSIDKETPSKLVVSAFLFEKIRIQAQTFDLTEYQGKPFRLYVEEDGDISTDIECSHYWLLLEAVIPEKKYNMVDTGVVDERGQAQTKCVEVALDLNDIDITVFALPEVAA